MINRIHDGGYLCPDPGSVPGWQTWARKKHLQAKIFFHV